MVIEVAPEFQWRSLVSELLKVPLLMRGACKTDLKKKNAAQKSNFYKQRFVSSGIPIPENLLGDRPKPKQLMSKSRRTRSKAGDLAKPTAPAAGAAGKRKQRKGGEDLSKRLQGRLGNKLAPALRAIETGERYKPTANPLVEAPQMAMDTVERTVAPDASFGPDPGAAVAVEESWYSDDEEVMEDEDEDEAAAYGGGLHMDAPRRSDSGYSMPSW